MDDCDRKNSLIMRINTRLHSNKTQLLNNIFFCHSQSVVKSILLYIKLLYIIIVFWFGISGHTACWTPVLK